MLRLPVEFFTQRYAGEIAARVAINDKVAALLSGRARGRPRSTPSLVVFFALLMFTVRRRADAVRRPSRRCNMLAVCASAVAGCAWTATGACCRSSGKLMGDARMGGLQTIETLKASGCRVRLLRALGRATRPRSSTAEQELAVVDAVLSARAAAPDRRSNTAAVLGIGGCGSWTARLTMGMLVAFQSLMASFLAPVNELVGLAAGCRRSRAT